MNRSFGINDERICGLAEKYDTPLYIYDRDVMTDNARCLKESLYPGASLYYAMKANPLMGICRIFIDEGLGIETASMGEMTVALKAGCPADKMIFTSPGKTEKELRYAIENRVGIINIDSLREAEIIDGIASEAGVKVDIGIRINPSVCYSNAKIKMTGIPSQFGIEEEELDEAFFDRLSAYKNIEIKGIQIYMGTQMLNAQDIVGNTRYAIELGLKLSGQYGLTLKYLNCGGGFGVRYFKNEEPLDTDELKTGMRSLHTEYGDRLSGTELVFESGRFLMATAGVMATKVLYRKDSKGMRYLVCDGGSNIHSSAAFLGRFVRNNFPLRAIAAEPDGETIETTVCGPLCTSLDVIGQKVILSGSVKENDIIVIEQSGAYGYTYSLGRFLSHEAPAEIMADAEGDVLLRERGIPEDNLVGQI